MIDIFLGNWKQSKCSVHVTGIDGGIAVAVCSRTSLTLFLKNWDGWGSIFPLEAEPMHLSVEGLERDPHQIRP